MTPRQYITWLKAAVECIGGMPSENQWNQILSKLAEVKTTTRKKADFTATQQEKEIIEYLNQKAKRNYDPCKTNVSFIRERIAEGATYDDLKRVITYMVVKWALPSEYNMYLRPATLFNRTKYAQYIGEVPTKIQLKAVQVRKCNYPGCSDNTQGPKHGRCDFHDGPEFKDPASEQVAQTKKKLKGRVPYGE